MKALNGADLALEEPSAAPDLSRASASPGDEDRAVETRSPIDCVPPPRGLAQFVARLLRATNAGSQLAAWQSVQA